LAGEIEARWAARFGAEQIEDLRRSLSAVVDQCDADLPRYLPITYPTQNGKADVPELREGQGPRRKSSGGGVVRQESSDRPELSERPDVSVLLSRALLMFTIEFERASRISLPISANTLRVLTADGVRMRDLPRLTGVSKAANAMASGFLARHECALLEADPSASRGKVARLTEKGGRAQNKFRRLLGQTETTWTEQFGADVVDRLRASLGVLVGENPGDAGARRSPLFAGLQPYPDGWRASVRPFGTLPHYPMVLHRGGYPDGN
jgi:hypothetical protein